MQPDTQSALFREKILKSNPTHLTLRGFECVKTFFESVNVSDGKMRRFGTQAVILISVSFFFNFLNELCRTDCRKTGPNWYGFLLASSS